MQNKEKLHLSGFEVILFDLLGTFLFFGHGVGLGFLMIDFFHSLFLNAKNLQLYIYI